MSRDDSELLIKDTVWPLAMAVTACVAIVLFIRLPLASTVPLWIDETWTAMIAGQQSWSDFWREAWLDVNPPLYYFVMKLWISVFGDSNLALRLPSFLFLIGAGVAAIALRPAWMPKLSAWLWAALIVLWTPGAVVMSDARAYALLILLSTLSAIVFMQLIGQLKRRLLCLWIGLGTMMFLIHYYTATLLAAQALIIVVIYRAKLLQHWPAALIAIPGLAWFALHIERLQQYTQPDVAWYQPVSMSKAVNFIMYVFGISFYHFIILIAFVAAFAFITRRKTNDPVAKTADRKLLMGFSVAILAIAFAFIISFFQPSLTARYFAPVMPFTMLGYVYLAQRSHRQLVISFMLLTIMILPSLFPERAHSLLSNRAAYGFEKVSDFTASADPDELIFVWDHPASKILDPNSLEMLGSYFLRRKGIAVDTTALQEGRENNMNELLAEAADGKQNPAIIWIYNSHFLSSASRNPPSLQSDPDWSCAHEFKDVAVTRFGSLGCVRAGAGGQDGR